MASEEPLPHDCRWLQRQENEFRQKREWFAWEVQSYYTVDHDIPSICDNFCRIKNEEIYVISYSTSFFPADDSVYVIEKYA